MLAATTAGACLGDGPAPLTLEEVPAPDTNTAVVVLDRSVHDGSYTLPGTEPTVYEVDVGHIPHTLYATRAFGTDTASLIVVVSALYTPGTVTTDGQVNRVAWTGPGGTRFEPAVPCPFDVVQPFTLSGPSLQLLELACPLVAEDGSVVTVLAKTSRYHPGG